MQDCLDAAFPNRLTMRVVLALVALCAAVASAPDPVSLANVLLIVLGSYGNQLAVTAAIDAFAIDATIFANAICQVAWCAPSRNSFLSGRRPAVTETYNFLDSFREVGPNWVTLPGNAGY